MGREREEVVPVIELVRERTVSRASVVVAFAAVYLIWGSTYLAIRWGIETMPPMLMAGARFLIAGGILLAWARLRGAAPPTPRHWASAALLGGLLLLIGNGGVAWSEQHIPSGLTALLVASVPLWMALLHRVDGRSAPGPWTWTGVGLGILGIAILVGPRGLGAGGGTSGLAFAAAGLASLSWSVGSLLAHRLPLPASPVLAIGMELFAGGALLAALGFATGEGARLDVTAVSARSWLALAYLVVFGSIIGFSAYVWLLRVRSPSLVATHAFVNPVVAVVLGWALAGEPLGGRTLVATAVIVAAVAMLTLPPRRGRDWAKQARVLETFPARAARGVAASRTMAPRTT